MNPHEQFECLNCEHVGALNRRGGCECCQSQAVFSLERIPVWLALAQKSASIPELESLCLKLESVYLIGAAGFWLEHQARGEKRENAA